MWILWSITLLHIGQSEEIIFAQPEQQQRCPHGRKITSHYKKNEVKDCIIIL